MSMADTGELITVTDLRNYLANTWVHDGVSFSVRKGEIVAIIGESGCGKTTLLRNILMLLPPYSGEIKVFGTDVSHISRQKQRQIQRRWGVMFQSGALFSSLTILENILFPLREFTGFSEKDCYELARMKLALVGLEQAVAGKYPAQLSGGMIKRAAVARAIALDPELLFFDEPTSGLDPKSASDLDELVLHLKYNIGLTVVLVTHDLDTLWRVPDKVMFLGEGKVLAMEPMAEMVVIEHPLVQAYFDNVRASGRQTVAGGEHGQ